MTTVLINTGNYMIGENLFINRNKIQTIQQFKQTLELTIQTK